MMEGIRRFLQSWVGRIFLVLCLSPLALLGLESYFTGGNDANTVATVGDVPISTAEYQNALTARRSELLASGVDASLINEQALQNEVLDTLINRALLKQHVNFLGIHVPDATISDTLQQEPQFLDADGNFSNDRFAYALKQQGLTKDGLFNEYRQQMGIMQLLEGISQTALYPNSTISNLLVEQQQSKPVWVHRLTWQDFADKVSVSEADIEAYFDEHTDELNQPAMVDLAYIKLSPKNIDIEPITDAEIEAQYQAFVTAQTQENQKKLSQILLTEDDSVTKLPEIEAKLADGADFAELAKVYSDDPSGQTNGGDIGTFNPAVFGDDAKKVTAAIANLQVGEVSKPVQSQFGTHIFKVTGSTGETVPSMETVRDDLVAQVDANKRAEAMADTITRINQQASEGVGLDKIAQQEGLKINTIKDYPKTDNQTALNQPSVIDAVFDEFLIQDGSVSPNIDVNETPVWVQPSNYRPVAPLTLAEASDDIRQELVKEKSIELALAKADTLASQVNNEGMDAVSVSFASLGEVTRQSPNISPSEVTTAFSEHHSGAKRVARATKTRAGASVVVIGEVNKLNADDIPDFEKQQAGIILKSNRGQEEFADYLEFLKLVTPVEKNEAVLSELL